MFTRLISPSHSLHINRSHFTPLINLSTLFHTHTSTRSFTSPLHFLSTPPSNQILLKKLEDSLKQNQFPQAWEAFTDFKTLHGFPTNNPLILHKLISQFCYSSDSYWLRKAFDLLLLIYKEGQNLIHYESSAKLAISLARAQLPVQASTVLRIMLELQKFPPMDLWKNAFVHMLRTETGCCLASDLLVEICECFVRHVEDYGTKNVKHLKLLKPDTMIFNLVLDACVRFGSSLKGEQIIELMALTGVVADATSIVLIAQIHERNGQRDELNKLKGYVDRVPFGLIRHYRQFYDSLLSLHFKFDDVDSAAELILDMYKHQESSSRRTIMHDDRKDPQKTFLVKLGSPNLKIGSMLQIDPELLQRDTVLSVGNNPQMVTFIDGKVVPSNKALAKIIRSYQRHGKVRELSELLVLVQKEADISGNTCLGSDVLSACINIRWLEIAHDILDDMESAGFSMDFDAYMSLLRAYHKENMWREAKVLTKQMRKRGWLCDLSDEDIISNGLLEKGCSVSTDKRFPTSFESSSLSEYLIRESKEVEPMSQLVYEINSSIYFFCKGNMMEDALKTYQRMQEREIQPTVQTFAHLINGYSKLRMYREITILWGEIKRKIDSDDLRVNRDLHEMLLWNFVQGGYFERVMEVLEYMKRNGMYTDKWKYRREFVKLYKHLYRSLKAENAKTEAQRKRLEHVQAFRKWLDID